MWDTEKRKTTKNRRQDRSTSASPQTTMKNVLKKTERTSIQNTRSHTRNLPIVSRAFF